MTDWRTRFDEIDAEVQDELAMRRRAASTAAAGRSPEDYARANAIADRRQLPVDVVADNLPDFEEQERGEAFESLARDYPATHPFLSDPRRVTLARDDAGGLTKLARSIRDGVALPWLRAATDANNKIADTAGEAVRGLYGGIGRGLQGTGDLIDAGAYALSRAVQGEEAADAYMRESRQAAWWQNPSQALRGAGRYVEGGLLFSHTNLAGNFDPLDEGRRNFATDVAGGLGNLGGQVMVSAVNPTTGVTLMAGQGAQQQAERADNAGASEGERAVAVTAGGAVTAALERVGLNKLLERLPPKVKNSIGQWIADKATAGIIEGAQEGAEQVANNAIARAVYEPEAELFEGAGENASVGAAVGLIARTILFPGRNRIDTGSPEDAEALRVLRSVDAAGRLEQITAAGAESKLAQRSPADAQAFAQAVAGDGRVYLPAGEAMRLFQSDERLLADLVGGEDVLAEQVATGDLSIPVAKWASIVARLPNVDEIQRYARLDPDGLSPVEIEQRDAMDAELFGQTDEAAARAVPAAVDARQQVVDDVTGQLLALNRYTPAQVEAQAKLWGAAFATMGQRANADPFALYQRYMLGVRNGDGPSVLASRPFVETARMDALIESVRRGRTGPAATGPSLTQWLREKGGVIDQGGELADFDARIAVPGLVSRSGMPLDRARELAAEAGFIEDGGTVADFLDAIDRDIRVGDVRSEKQADPERAQFERERQDIIAAIQDNPRLRDMPPSEFEALSNQQIIDELFPARDYVSDRYDFGVRDLIPSPVDGVVESAETRRLVDAAVADGDLAAMLRGIAAQDGIDADLAALSEHLAGVVPNLGIRVVRAPDAPDAGGIFDQDTGELWVGVARPSIVLHEVLHGATSRLLVAGPDVRAINPAVAQAQAEMEGLLAHVRAYVADNGLDRDPKFGPYVRDQRGPLANTRELLTYGMTDARFQELLRTIPAPQERQQKRTTWQWFKDSVWSLVGYERGVSRAIDSAVENRPQTALDAVIETTGALVDFAGDNPDVVTAARRPMASQDRAAAPESRSLIERAVDGVRTLFQSKPADQTKTKEFKRWFGDSNVVDENGEPLVVYHGTDSTPFEVFDRAKGGSGPSKFGFWFSNQEAFSELFGGNMMPVYLKMENPKRITLEKWNSIRDRHAKDGEWFNRWREELIAQGHDGLVVAGGTDQVGKFSVQNPDVLAVFEPTQIKSATGNRGTFDPNNPSILNQQQTGEGPRGQINIFPDRRMSIELFERADRTTFLHESGHFFFEVMRDLATAPDAAPDLAADFNALREWMGAAPDAELNEDQLEQFARGFEAYLGEGKAPSPELQSAFAKFAAWIMGVYRTLRGLNVTLTDDVRAVFDRMLATEDEIAAAQARQGMAPLPIGPSAGAEIGLTEKQFADYVALTEAAAEEARADVRQKMLKALERERKAWWKEERAKVHAEVSARYEATPAVRALRILSGRRSINGVEVPEELRGLKLDREAVVAGWGEAYLARLGRTYSRTGGVSPDEAAAALGYASGDDLLRAVANAPDLIVRVDAETDSIMRERHGDPMTDGTLAEVAMDAVHGSRRVQVLERELDLLAQLAGQPAPSRRVTKSLAERRIAAKTARQVRPNDYLVAERRAAREATVAAARGDYAEALAAKRRQALNVAMYSAARDAVARFERQVRYLQLMEKSGRRARLGKAGGEYLEQVDALLEAVEMRPASGPQVDRRRRLAEWVARMEKEGRPINVPPRLLYEAGLTNLRDMPLSDVAGLVETIKQIEHLAKTKTRLFDGRQERDRAELDAEMAASVKAAHGERPERTGDELLPEKVRRMVADIDLARLQPTNIARELDGYEAGGPVWTNLVLPIRRAIFERVQPEMRKMQDAVAAIYAKHYTPEELRRLDAPVWREKVGDHWSKGRILSMAMHWGSAGNREAILTQAQSRLTEAQAVDLLRTLDARDWAFVQSMVDQVNSYWPEIAAAQRRRTGLVPEKVEAAPFTITAADGQAISVRGGYFPLSYDADRSGFGVSREESDDIYNDLRVGKTARAATKHGHTIERTDSAGKTVRLDLDLATTHMRTVIRDLHLGDAVAYAHDALNGQEFTRAAIAAGRRGHLQALELWLKDVAAGEMGGRHVLEKVAAHVRLNLTASVLTWKASSALLQVTGFVQSASVIGNRAMLVGIRRLMSKWWMGPNSIYNDIRARSPFMAERFGMVADQVEAVANARAGRLKAAHAAMIRWGYVPMARVQMMVDAATWLAGESVGLKLFDGDPERARAYADDLVVRAQSSSEFLDKSQLQRGTLNERIRQSELVRASTMLQSYMMAKGNIVREKYQLAKFTRPGDVFKFGVDMIQLFAVEAMILGLVRNGLPDDDEDDDGMVDEWATYIAKETSLGILGTLPGGSPLASEWKGFTAQGPTDRAWGVLADSTGEWMDGELDRNDLRRAVDLSGVAAGVPSSQINTTAGALWRVHDGEDVSPLDYIIRPEKPRD